MIIGKNILKQSESFKNVEKDLSYIVSEISQDEQILKYLSLQENRETELSSKEKKEILKKCVKIVPKITAVNSTDWSYITVHFDNFLPNGENPAFRDKFLIFDIICNFDTWDMEDFKLRPYQIAGRLDVLFDNKSLCGTYSLKFLNASSLVLDDNIAGLTLIYEVTYSEGSDRVD